MIGAIVESRYDQRTTMQRAHTEIYHIPTGWFWIVKRGPHVILDGPYGPFATKAEANDSYNHREPCDEQV